ncbi:hypothetical protein C8J57DRAFT_1725683 [Mycena rebaudengoi]|nr:hypothetical protein C8J57DRAFT_1725683 [Mycena rebaudengoi]
MGTLPTNAVNPFRVCAASACRLINPFASPGASSIVDVPHASYSTSSRPNSANSPASRHSALGASPRLPPVIISLGGGRRSRRAPPRAPRSTPAPRPPQKYRDPRPQRERVCGVCGKPLSPDGSMACPPPPCWTKKVVKDIGKKKGSKAMPMALDKLWLRAPDPHAGVGMAALRIVFGLHDVLLQNPASLCPVLDEDFAGATT